MSESHTNSPPKSTAAKTAGIIALAVATLAVAAVAFKRAWDNAGPATAAATTSAPSAPRTPTAEARTAILESAQTYIRRNEPGNAEAVLAQAAREYSEDQEIRIAYADVLLTQRKLTQASEQYEKALAIGPRPATLEFTAGTAANMAGNPQLALEHYLAAQAADKTNAQYPLFAAQVQIKLNQSDAAKASLIRSTMLDSQQPAAWGTLAELALRDNNANVALQHIEKARKLDSGALAWRLIEARALKRVGKPREAVDLLVTLDDAQRLQPAVLQQIAECYGMLKQPADAAAIYARASDAQRDNPDLAKAAADWFNRAGNAAKAAEYSSRAR